MQTKPAFQFGLNPLICFMSIMALFCTAFGSANSFLISAVDLTTIFLLGGSLVAAVGCTDERRVFWFAFFVFSLLYLAASTRNMEFLGITQAPPTTLWCYQLARLTHPDYWAAPQLVAMKGLALFVGLLAACISQAIYLVETQTDGQAVTSE